VTVGTGRALLALALALVLTALASATASAQSSDATLPDLEDEVMCVVCGTTLGLSESPAADRQRVLIREGIARGLDKEEIKQELVAEYGPAVLATPGTSGFDLAAWLVPGLALLFAGVALAIGVRRWRAGGRAGQTAAPAPASGGDPDGEERLAADLRRYEL
jgi:cytochrome c-type biogenesis protein CcmH